MNHLTDVQTAAEPDPLPFLHLQLELECKRVTSDGWLYPVPCENPDPMPRLFVAKHAQGWTTYFRYDLAQQLREQLTALTAERLWEESDIVKAILREGGAESEVSWRGRTCYFASAPSIKQAPDVVEQEGAFVVLRDGKPVSWAWSSRENEKAAELALETLPAYRRRGFAYQVAVAWANRQLSQQKVAFYSHLLDNLPSGALAVKLNVVPLFDAVGYD